MRKHNLLKYGGCRRQSWRKFKTYLHRYNRRESRLAIMLGVELPYIDMKLSAWDWDCVKSYFTDADIQEMPELKRK